MIQFPKKNIIPISIGKRAESMTRIANSGENCGFDYHVTRESLCFYSMYNFPIDSILKTLLKDFSCQTYECDYEDWFPCGDEHKFYSDSQITSHVCNFLTAYFNFKYPGYNLVFTPSTSPMPTEDNYWKNNGVCFYRLEFPLQK